MESVTGIGVVDWFLGLLNAWGYLLVVGFTIFENLFIIGSFTPGETVVMAAAFLSTPANGTLTLAWVWVCSVVGTVLGSNITYLIGRRGGRDTLLRWGRRFRIGEERIHEAETYFYTHGSKTIFMSRFAAGFKNVVPMIAGVSRMQLAYFEGWTLLGAITYTSAMCAIGYFIGDNFDRALAIAQSLGYAGFLLFVGFLTAVLMARRRYTQHRREELAEEYAEDRADIERAFDTGEIALPPTERPAGDEEARE